MELGWPHEWDPIAAGDTCTAVEPPTITFNGRSPFPNEQPHKVEKPYVRHGSGYACAECIEVFA